MHTMTSYWHINDVILRENGIILRHTVTSILCWSLEQPEHVLLGCKHLKMCVWFVTVADENIWFVMRLPQSLRSTAHQARFCSKEHKAGQHNFEVRCLYHQTNQYNCNIIMWLTVSNAAVWIYIVCLFTSVHCSCSSSRFGLSMLRSILKYNEKSKWNSCSQMSDYLYNSYSYWHTSSNLWH